MIRFGQTEDIPELKKLWKECFADEDAYIDAFFYAVYQGKHVLAVQENGALIGASFFLPGSIYIEESWQQIRYVYALAVYPQYRGRGIAGRLLQEASEIYKAPFIAEPAEESLVAGFYEPLGFSKTFYLSKKQTALPQYDIQAAQSQAFHIQPADAEAYGRIRDERFKKYGYVRWPKEHLAFALSEHRANGGDALLVTGEDREDILLYYTEGSKAFVTETTLTQEDAVSVLLQCLEQPCDTLTLTGRVRDSRQCIGKDADGSMQEAQYQAENSERRLTGVMRGSTCAGGYLNLTLD